MTSHARLKEIRWLTLIFILGLVLSGATAIPLKTEVNRLTKIFSSDLPSNRTPLNLWLSKVSAALEDVANSHAFLFYGTDWLAFAHFTIALAFVGVLRDPVRNRWLYDFGLIACAAIIPYAFIFGALRGIPIWWRLIDCSFGLFGAIPLWFCREWTRQLESSNHDCNTTKESILP